jgi:hypothetical protein
VIIPDRQALLLDLRSGVGRVQHRTGISQWGWSALGRSHDSDRSPATSALPGVQTFSGPAGRSVSCQCTKSLRCSPLRGGKSRETGSQLRGKRWRV